MGVAYNVFDGEELLESSIKSIRDNVDYISVIFQEVSWRDKPCSEELEDTLSDLVNNKYVDQLHNFTQEVEQYKNQYHFAPRAQEIFKRNIGVLVSRRNNCTHHMSMDCDEYYKKKDFKYMKDIMLQGNYDGAVCEIVNYFKDPTYQITPECDYHVSTIFKIPSPKIGYDTPYGSDYRKYPVKIDPTRVMECRKLKVFKRFEIEMHHMSFIRKNIRMKFENSSADDARTSPLLENFLEEFETYKLGDELPVFRPREEGDKIEKTIKVENVFNVPKF